MNTEDRQMKDMRLEDSQMSEEEVLERYRAMAAADAPQIWDEISRRLDQAEALQEDVQPQTGTGREQESGQTEAAGDQAQESSQAEAAGAQEQESSQAETAGREQTRRGDEKMEKKQEIKPEGKAGKKKLWKRIFTGSSLSASAAIFAICLLGMGTLGTVSRLSEMGSSYEKFSFEEAASGKAAQKPEQLIDLDQGETPYAPAGNSGGFAAKSEAAVEDGEVYDIDGIEEAAPLAEGEYSADSAARAAENGSGSSAEAGEIQAGAAQQKAAEAEKSGENDSQTAEEKTENKRKLIRTINIDAETKEFDKVTQNIKKQVSQAGGYIESSSTSGSSYSSGRSTRDASFTIRIPSGKTDEFLSKVRGETNVTYTNEGTEDVTLTYVDMQSHVKVLREEQTQLMKLMEKAESMEDLLSIRSQLTDIRYELESYESQLKTYDNLVEYDTVHLNITEVEEITPVAPRTIWQKMGDGFMNGLKGAAEAVINFLIMIVSSLPYLAILFALIFGIVSLVKMIRSRRRKQK